MTFKEWVDLRGIYAVALSMGTSPRQIERRLKKWGQRNKQKEEETNEQ